VVGSAGGGRQAKIAMSRHGRGLRGRTNGRAGKAIPPQSGVTVCDNHRLRGSASPLLTATGFVNGKWQYSTPTESTPLNRSPKKL